MNYTELDMLLAKYRNRTEASVLAGLLWKERRATVNDVRNAVKEELDAREAIIAYVTAHGYIDPLRKLTPGSLY